MRIENRSFRTDGWEEDEGAVGACPALSAGLSTSQDLPWDPEDEQQLTTRLGRAAGFRGEGTRPPFLACLLLFSLCYKYRLF